MLFPICYVGAMTIPTRSSEPAMDGRLTPAAADLLRSIRATGFASWSDLGIEAARAAISEMKALAGSAEPVARVEEIRISRGDAADMCAALYMPKSSRP